ncbi:hypothetical protein [Nocardia sp. NBC_00416]|uniref:hypothetical protein n=1 Tax=Nocardia sp. NBC_00416 TaxID=2975991 RepID=UPI002E1A5355
MTRELQLGQWLHRVRMVSRRILAATDDDSRRRTDRGGRPPNSLVERGMGRIMRSRLRR